MKTKSSLTITLAVVLVGFVALAGGCALFPKKSGIARAEKTTASMQTVDYDIKQANLQIDTTKASLDSLVKVGQMPTSQPDDVKTAYDTFTQQADKMKEIGKNLNNHIDEMNAQGNSYFTEWAKEGGTYTNPQIQKESAERRARLSNAFRDMEMAAASARPNLNAYMSDIDQIKKYLSNDLTPKGITAMMPTANKFAEDGTKLKHALAPVEKSIMEARAELTTGGAAAGGVSGTQQPQSSPTSTTGQ